MKLGTYHYHYERHNIDGTGSRPRRVYDVPPVNVDKMPDYWAAVTDIPCPICGVKSAGVIRWAENGYVPGYRICDRCGRHFLAGGDAQAPTLITMGRRRKYFNQT